jgi:predicted amidophosphoribosyltransferase
MIKKELFIRLIRILKDIQALFFPPICLGCRGPVAGESVLICTFCQANMPFTSFHLKKDNKMEMRFWGRINIVQATSFLHFQKGSSVQNLLHYLKYEHREDIGIYLGNWYGRELDQSSIYEQIDYVIPVPIHQKRYKKRGYNQVAKFSQCKGIQGRYIIQNKKQQYTNKSEQGRTIFSPGACIFLEESRRTNW